MYYNNCKDPKMLNIIDENSFTLECTSTSQQKCQQKVIDVGRKETKKLISIDPIPGSGQLAFAQMF